MTAIRPHVARRSRYLFASIVAICLLVASGSYRALFSAGVDAEADQRLEHLAALSQSLGATLRKYEELPLVVAQDPRVRKALTDSGQNLALNEANRYLEKINQILGTETIYAMNEHGLTLVSSNWNKADSYVGDNYAFRPYFSDAIEKGSGKFFGIGVASGKPGYYIAYPIRKEDRIIGVVTIKIAISEILNQAAEENSVLLVTNEDGIVILSTDSHYLYQSTEVLDASVRERIVRTRQFANQPLNRLDFHGTAFLLQRDTSPQLLAGDRYLAQAVSLGGHGWQIVQISNTDAARVNALASAAAISFGLAFVLITLLNFWNRRQDRREKARIYADIDRQIAAHTRSLTDKVSELEKAESVLRQTRDEAVQAGKMAVLGQMAAGITHELSQPLSAIQLYAGNTRKLMDAGRYDIAGDNVAHINDLVARMGSILSELKSLYRNDPTQIEAVSLGQVIRNALVVMNPFLEKAGITLTLEIEDASVLATQGKLEQVFVNLISNAVDALSHTADGQIRIGTQRIGPDIIVHLADNGPGIAPEKLPLVFEPFFTTKPSGQGLGLGLAITRFIVDAIGGKISCKNLPAGGLEFILKLRAVKTESS